MTKRLVDIIPILQTAQLVDTNFKALKKKNKGTKDILRLGVTNIAGTNLIKLTDDFLHS